jgi:hypothetical protein
MDARRRKTSANLVSIRPPIYVKSRTSSSPFWGTRSLRSIPKCLLESPFNCRQVQVIRRRLELNRARPIAKQRQDLLHNRRPLGLSVGEAEDRLSVIRKAAFVEHLRSLSCFVVKTIGATARQCLDQDPWGGLPLRQKRLNNETFLDKQSGSKGRLLPLTSTGSTTEHWRLEPPRLERPSDSHQGVPRCCAQTRVRGRRMTHCASSGPHAIA